MLDLGNGSFLPDPSTFKDWLRESDAIISWPPLFLSGHTVFLMDDDPGKDAAFERVFSMNIKKARHNVSMNLLVPHINCIGVLFP